MTDTKNTVSDERLAEMLAGLECVTPGPWGLFSHGRTICIDNRGGDGRRPSIVDWPGFDQNDQPLKVNRKNAAHIARCDPDTVRSLITELQSLRASIPGGVGVKGLDIADTCDGKEQEAFEAWAASERYDMEEHPMHYLFMNPKTDAARMGWKAGIRHSRDRILSALDLSPAEPMPMPPIWEAQYLQPSTRVCKAKDVREALDKTAAPSNPVISDEMVERAAKVLVPAWYGGFEDQTQKEDGSGWVNPPGTPNERARNLARSAITAALSVKPQRGE